MAPDQRLKSRGQSRIRPASRRIRAADRVICIQRRHLGLAFEEATTKYAITIATKSHPKKAVSYCFSQPEGECWRIELRPIRISDRSWPDVFC